MAGNFPKVISVLLFKWKRKKGVQVALFIMAAIVFSAGFLWMISPTRPLAPNNYSYIFLNDRIKLDHRMEDDCAYVSYAAKNLASDASHLIIGSSAAREALWEPSRLEQEVSGFRDGLLNNRDEFKVVKLTSSAQSFLTGLFIVELAQVRPDQTVYYFLSPPSFIRKNETIVRMQSGLFLESTYEFARKYNEQFNWLSPLTTIRAKHLMRLNINRIYIYRGMFNRFREFSAKYLFDEEFIPYTAFSYDEEVSGNKHFIDSYLSRVERKFNQKFPNNNGENLKIFEKTIEILSSQNTEVVIFHSPELYPRTFSKHIEEYHRLVNNLAKKYSLEVVDLNEKVKFTYYDFYDGRHMVASGRKKWSQAFLSWYEEDLQEKQILAGNAKPATP